MPAAQQEAAIKSGAMWKYINNLRLVKCPTGCRGELQTYGFMDSMNGLARTGTYNGGRGVVIGKTVLWIKKLSEITSPAPSLRAVLLDEGRTTPDSFAVFPDHREWWDPPLVRHGSGTNVSFADGHVGYWKWKDPTTLKLARDADENKYFTSPSVPKRQDNDDTKLVQFSCWGRLNP